MCVNDPEQYLCNDEYLRIPYAGDTRLLIDNNNINAAKIYGTIYPHYTCTQCIAVAPYELRAITQKLNGIRNKSENKFVVWEN